jgi:signal transduction histidine kinase
VADAWRVQLSSALSSVSQDGCADRLEEALARAEALRQQPGRQGGAGWTQHLVFLLPGVAALTLVGLAISHIDHSADLQVFLVVLVGLVASHLVLRARNRRVAAEHEAARVREELDLRQRVAECEQRRHRLVAYSQLAAQIAHEVRNPLSSIVLNTELLEEEMAECRTANSVEIRALVGAIKSEAGRLHALTDEYLAFARLPAPDRSLVRLDALASDTAAFMREEAARQNVDLVIGASSGQATTTVDPRQVRQVIVNLLRNAIEATPAGGRVEVRTFREPGHVVLDVADSGPGVPDGQRDLIFEPFYSTKDQGTGLGLSVALRIVQEHGGTLEVVPGEGACFRMRLPAAPAALEGLEPDAGRSEPVCEVA